MPITLQLYHAVVEYGLLVGAYQQMLGPFRRRFGYPHSYRGGGHTVAWSGTIFIGPISEFCTFIFDYQVMHDNTCVHDISNAVSIPQACWTLQRSPSRLEHTKCPLHILARSLLSLGKLNFLWIDIIFTNTGQGYIPSVK